MSEPLNPEVAILNAALELPAAQRAVYLDQACAGNAALRRQVETLLKADDQAHGFLDSLPPVLAFTQSDLKEFPLTEKPGDKIGRYKLLQKIGEGGCGVVYMAEQEEPVRRRVALKVIKLGMDTKEFVARFDAERQALALMDHPNIAKVFDAGATDAGRPYFVMELVRGIKITEFCDENKLSTEERLKLFILVCQAIQHAHQKGVIHRDIKPSNILVTVNDGVPVPKVIDFGIAKATAGRLTDQTLFTAFEQFIGTPAYMSPEQAVMTSLDIDTRSDIYSLGVLLYQLLTGKTPFDGQELLKAGLDEMRRVIREVEPLKPSTRLTQERAAQLARSAKSAIGNRQSAIDKDLDWIVMKCLEKDRARRYETANGLATDLQRHLNSEAVAARPPSNLYRFQKLIRRNKLAFTAAAAVATVLVIGVVASTWQAIRATRAEHEQSKLREAAETAESNEARARQQAEADATTAKAEAAKSEQVSGFLKEMLRSVGPSVAMGRDTSLMRDILDKTAARVGKDLTNQPLVEAELRTVLAGTYQELDLYEPAAEMSRAALRLYKSRLGEKHHFVAHSQAQLAVSLGRLHQYSEAEPLLRGAIQMQREFVQTNDNETLEWLHNLAALYEWMGKLEEAEALYRQVIQEEEKRGNQKSTVASRNNLGGLLLNQGRYREAERVLTNAVALSRRLFGSDYPSTLSSMNMLAELYRHMHRHAEAEALQREEVQASLRVRGPGHPRTLISMNNLALVLIRLERYAEAESLFTNVIVVRQRSLGEDHPDVFHVRQNLAYLHHKQGRLDLAEQEFTNLLAIAERTSIGDRREALACAFNLAGVYRKQGRLSQAEALLTNTIPTACRVLPPGSDSMRYGLGDLSDLYQAQGRTQEAIRVYSDALGLLRVRFSNDPPALARHLLHMSDWLRAEDRREPAEEFLREITAMTSPGVEPSVLQALNRLGGRLRKLNRAAEAVPLCRRALELATRFYGPENGHVGDELFSLAAALSEAGQLPEAEVHARAALDMLLRTDPDDTEMILSARSNLANIRWSRGDRDGAEQILRDALALVREKASNDPVQIEKHLLKLADLVVDRQKFGETVSLNREVVQSQRARLPAEDEDLMDSTTQLALWLTEWAWKDRYMSGLFLDLKLAFDPALPAGMPKPAERAREAERLLRDCLAVRTKTLRKNSTRLGETKGRLGGALVAQAATDPTLTTEARLTLLAEAEPLLVEAHAVQQRNNFAIRRFARNAFIRLGRLHETWEAIEPGSGHAAKAAEWNARRAAFGRESSEPNSTAKENQP